MILDKNALLSDQQAITATAASTSSYDFGAMGITAYNGVQLRRKFVQGGEVPLLVQVTETFNTLTSLTIALQMDADTNFGSPTTIISFSVPLADLVEGYKLPINKLPEGITERYFRLLYTVVGANPTLGKITAGFVGAVDYGYKG